MFYFFEKNINIPIGYFERKIAMSSRLSGAGIFAQVASSLNSSYGTILANALKSDDTKTGISLDDILSASSSTSSLLSGTTFSSYLSSSFSAIDADGDGNVTSSELTSYSNTLLQQGMTLEELTLLASQYGGASESLQKVIDNFTEVDANHDGRVTQSEISAYGVDEEISEKKEDYPTFDSEKFFSYYN